MMYYVMLAAATVLFSAQFLFNQKFEEECGASMASAALFSLYTSVGGFLILFALNGFVLKISSFSLGLAFVYAFLGTAYSVASIKAFEVVNLSAYSVFSMLGGMLLPSVYGILFCEEPITSKKIVCALLIAAALLFSMERGKKGSCKRYYIEVFVLNGMVGVISVIHQSDAGGRAVDSFCFLMLARAAAALLSVLLFCVTEPGAMRQTTQKAVGYAGFYAAFCGIGNLLVLLALKHLPASVQYPIITGGVMAISLVISLIRGEKNSWKNIAAAAIAFLSTIFII